MTEVNKKEQVRMRPVVNFSPFILSVDDFVLSTSLISGHELAVASLSRPPLKQLGKVSVNSYYKNNELCARRVSKFFWSKVWQDTPADVGGRAAGETKLAPVGQDECFLVEISRRTRLQEKN